MRSFLKVLTAVCIISGVVILGGVLGWFGTKTPTPEATIQPTPPEPSSETAAAPNLSSRTNQTRKQPPPLRTNEKTAPLSTNVTNTNSDWEDKLEAILGSEGEDADKAKQMFAMYPKLPEDGQVEVAQHLSNLVSDQDYAPLGKLLSDAKQPDAVLDVLIADLLNRPNARKLPLLLELARNGQHPKATEAKDLLELYLEEDYGQNWDKWQAKTEQWLKDNPD